MKTYFVKQKFRLGGERFDIKDDQGRVAYQVEGSFFKIPKTFTIFGEDGREISHITKEPLSLLPKFTVDLQDGSSFYVSAARVPTQATRLRPKKPSSPSPRIPRASTSSNPWSKRTWVRAPHKKAPRPQRGRLWRYDSDNNVIRQESEKEHGYQKV